ncbi:Hypothetical protein PHPALM_8604 [Phytophthora palmivora]|uniref:Uncharacterized protein n=1 Tax=Phytophthora palmivora TaxID=4796 RepID=A0A2P4Y9E3_9STRA|nr:Hypothetical protein PHPALM_8604 [Phytophthora palmivora]
MPARRETPSKAEAFQARPAGRSAAERQRLAAEHRAFIDGERANDADFGDDEPLQVTAAPTPMSAPTSRSFNPPPPRPHTGKSAAYIQTLKARMAAKLAEEAAEKAAQAEKAKTAKTAKQPPAKMKGNMSKKRMAEIAREEKQGQWLRSAEKKKQRDRVVQEEREGHDARQLALADLKKKREEAASRKQTASLGASPRERTSGKRKTPSTSASSTKQKETQKRKKPSPHAEDADGEADDEGLQANLRASPYGSDHGSTSPTVQISPLEESLLLPQARQVSRPPSWRPNLRFESAKDETVEATGPRETRASSQSTQSCQGEIDSRLGEDYRELG